MSTYWGYHCKTCGARSPFDYDGGEQMLTAAFRDIMVFRCAMSVPAWDALWFESVRIAVFRWLFEHEGHEIELVNGWYDRLPADRVQLGRVPVWTDTIRLALSVLRGEPDWGLFDILTERRLSAG